LNAAGLLDPVYLVGGVAVAWHLAHRRSVDLDLFSRKPQLDLETVREIAVRRLGATAIAQTDATLALLLGRIPIARR